MNNQSPFNNPYPDPPYGGINVEEVPPTAESSQKSSIVVFIGVISAVAVCITFYLGSRGMILTSVGSADKDLMVWLFRILFIVTLVLVMIILPAASTILLGEEGAEKRRRCTVLTHGTLAGIKEVRHRRSNTNSFHRYYYTYKPKYMVEVNGRRQIRTLDVSRGTPNQFIQEADFLVDPLGGDIILASEYDSDTKKNGISYAFLIWIVVLGFFMLGLFSVQQSNARRKAKEQTPKAQVYYQFSGSSPQTAGDRDDRLSQMFSSPEKR